MIDFLPKDYKVPTKSNNYMRFAQGENRFRILSSPIIGYEYWKEDINGKRSPIRRRSITEIDLNIVDGNSVKHFWAMPVWNYQEKKIQILEIYQKRLQRSISSLVADKDWGTPLNYDLVVTKSGEKMETEYTVQPKPIKPLDDKIIQVYEEMSINLEALYEGKDPFSTLEEVDPEEVPL